MPRRVSENYYVVMQHFRTSPNTEIPVGLTPTSPVLVWKENKQPKSQEEQLNFPTRTGGSEWTGPCSPRTAPKSHKDEHRKRLRPARRVTWKTWRCFWEPWFLKHASQHEWASTTDDALPQWEQSVLTGYAQNSGRGSKVSSPQTHNSKMLKFSAAELWIFKATDRPTASDARMRMHVRVRLRVKGLRPFYNRLNRFFLFAGIHILKSRRWIT